MKSLQKVSLVQAAVAAAEPAEPPQINLFD